MINETFTIPKEVKKQYPPIPENIYQAELLDITLSERPKYKQPEVLEKVLSFQFTILQGKDKDGTSLRGRNIWRNFVPTYFYIGKNGKNVLYSIVEAVLGRDITQEEEVTFSSNTLNSYVGKQVRILIKNITKKDKTFSNIVNFLPIENELPRLTSEEKETAQVKVEKLAQEPMIDLADIPF